MSQIVKYMTAEGHSIEYTTIYLGLTQEDISAIACTFFEVTDRTPNLIALSPLSYKATYNNIFPQLCIDNNGTVKEIIRTAIGPCILLIVPEWKGNFILCGTDVDLQRYKVDEIFEKEVLS